MESIYVVLGIALVAIILVTILYLKIKKYKIAKRGIKGERKVASILKRVAMGKPFKVINDLYLPLYDKTTQIDHVLIGPFGVLVIETKNYSGEVYGNPAEKEWMQICGNEKNKFYNPLKQNKTHTDNIRYIFGKEDIYSIQIDSLIVFADKKLQLYVPKGLPIIKSNKLKKEMRKFKYRHDNGVDVDRVYNALLKYQVKDKDLLKKHNKNVKKMSKMK